MRTRSAGQPTHWARPPQTPAIIRSWERLSGAFGIAGISSHGRAADASLQQGGQGRLSTVPGFGTLPTLDSAPLFLGRHVPPAFAHDMAPFGRELEEFPVCLAYGHLLLRA